MEPPGAVMDKFAGDDPMAVFVAPVPPEIGAGRALSRCAISQLNDADVSDAGMPA